LVLQPCDLQLDQRFDLPESIEALKNSDVDAAIVLAFNPADPSVTGREKVLTEGGVAGQTKGMLEIAEYCGIKRRFSTLQQPARSRQRRLIS